MRYYDIQIMERADGSGNEPQVFKRYSSHKNGVSKPGALMIEMDVSRFDFGTPQQESRLTIWGLSPEEMQQDILLLPGREIVIHGGMMGGLPLSRGGVAGLIVHGRILQVLGNWEGAQLRQDIIITAQPLGEQVEEVAALAPINLTLPWREGVKLSVALAQCFQTLGDYSFRIDISDRLVNNYDASMFCGSLEELARALKEISKAIIKDKNYIGVNILFQENTIIVYDNMPASQESPPVTELKFTDLIGQPTWIKYNVISVICVMRSDLIVGNIMRLPREARPIGISASASQYRNRLAFTGDFMISKVRFLGNSRELDAGAWVVVVEGFTLQDVST